MGRKQKDSEFGSWFFLIVLFLGAVSCFMVYTCLSMAFRPGISNQSQGHALEVGLKMENGKEEEEDDDDDDGSSCCNGIEHLELWGDAVNWGSKFKVNSSEECCKACKDLCSGVGGPCSCNSWVFCGSRESCGPNFGECWLKKQKDALQPDWRDSGNQVGWTSGLIFGKGQGVVGLETEFGIIRIQLGKFCTNASDGTSIAWLDRKSLVWKPRANLMKVPTSKKPFWSNKMALLFPDCAPLSVNYILELLALHHCAGCYIYRAEGRGDFWDEEGFHKRNAPHGPPYALIQGVLEAHGNTFKSIPTEVCPTLRKGSVAWVGQGPDFFISLADHREWKKAYTVFGSVLPDDMKIAEKITQQPSEEDTWSNITIRVLKRPIPLRFQRLKS